MQVVYLLIGFQTKSLPQQAVLFLIVAKEQNMEVIGVK